MSVSLWLYTYKYTDTFWTEKKPNITNPTIQGKTTRGILGGGCGWARCVCRSPGWAAGLSTTQHEQHKQQPAHKAPSKALFFFCPHSQRGGECVRGWASVRKKKEKGLKHWKKVMQRDTKRDLYTGSFKLCCAARGTKLTVWAASGNAGLYVCTTANMRPVTAPKIEGRYLQCVLQCLCMHPRPPPCISNTNSLCSSYKTSCKRLSRIRQPHWRVIRGICETGFTCSAPV